MLLAVPALLKPRAGVRTGGRVAHPLASEGSSLITGMEGEMSAKPAGISLMRQTMDRQAQALARIMDDEASVMAVAERLREDPRGRLRGERGPGGGAVPARPLGGPRPAGPACRPRWRRNLVSEDCRSGARRRKLWRPADPHRPRWAGRAAVDLSADCDGAAHRAGGRRGARRQPRHVRAGPAGTPSLESHRTMKRAALFVPDPAAPAGGGQGHLPTRYSPSVTAIVHPRQPARAQAGPG